jgi:hypothetical protein
VKWNVLNVVTGAMAGFVVGFMAGMAVQEGFACLVGGALGAVCGGWAGILGGVVARWCAGTAAVVGGLSFAAGFFGPIVFDPDNNLGPLLGIFYTGPLGTVAGAVLGALIGLVVRANRARSNSEGFPNGQTAAVLCARAQGSFPVKPNVRPTWRFR